MKKVRLRELLAIAVLCGTARAPQASLLRAMSLEQLVTSSNEIIVAKVISVKAAWDPPHRRILSTIEVKIEECWKGAAGEFITIVQPGGTVGDIEMTVHGMPKFTAGERSLLFLRGQTNFQVVGMSEGKRPVAWDADSKRWMVESPNVEDTVDVDAAGRLHPAAQAAQLDLESMRARVRKMIRN